MILYIFLCGESFFLFISVVLFVITLSRTFDSFIAKQRFLGTIALCNEQTIEGRIFIKTHQYSHYCRLSSNHNELVFFIVFLIIAAMTFTISVFLQSLCSIKWLFFGSFGNAKTSPLISRRV